MEGDGLSERLLATFLLELEEQVQIMTADVLALESEPTNAERLKRLFRGAHTLKGAAHAAAVPLIQQACHRLESLLSAVRQGDLRLKPEHITLLLDSLDALADAGTRLHVRMDLDDSPLAGIVTRLSEQVREGRVRSAPFEPRATTSPVPSPSSASHSRSAPASRSPSPAPGPAAVPAATTAPVAETAADPAPGAGGAASVRIDAAKFDALLASVAGMQAASRHVLARRDEALEIQQLIARTRARSAAERHAVSGSLRAADASGGGSDGDALLHALDELSRGADRLAAHVIQDGPVLAHAADQLRVHARALRMRPFDDATERLPRIVRDLAAVTGKEVRFELQGGDTEVDRAVLDRLGPALLHLVRNAVAHGIEAPDERERKGKPRAGTVRVSVEVAGDRLVVRVMDDGTGLDLARLRERLAAMGAPAPWDDAALADSVFMAGVSTRQVVTDEAGRGVGLDAARAAVESVRGRIEVATVPGEGTTFTLNSPLTLALVRVVIMEAAGEQLAVPTAAVQHLLRLRITDFAVVDGRDVIATDSGPVPVSALAALLDSGAPDTRPHEIIHVALVQGAAGRLALLVDGFIAEEEVLVRPLHQIQPPIPVIAGAAVRGDGSTVLVLETDALAEDALSTRASAVLNRAGAADELPRVLVADDSITTRTLLQGVLESAGYSVSTAVDGRAALDLLLNESFDLLVSDVEMPRLDGFELCRAVRALPSLARLPIILVTGLETDDQRRRGLDAGADAYLGKSSFNQTELLDRITQLLD